MLPPSTRWWHSRRKSFDDFVKSRLWRAAPSYSVMKCRSCGSGSCLRRGFGRQVQPRSSRSAAADTHKENIQLHWTSLLKSPYPLCQRGSKRTPASLPPLEKGVGGISFHIGRRNAEIGRFTKSSVFTCAFGCDSRTEGFAATEMTLNSRGADHGILQDSLRKRP